MAEERWKALELVDPSIADLITDTDLLMAFQTRGTITAVHNPSDYEDCCHADGGASKPVKQCDGTYDVEFGDGRCGWHATIKLWAAPGTCALCGDPACLSEVECNDDDTAWDYFLAQFTRRQQSPA